MTNNTRDLRRRLFVGNADREYEIHQCALKAIFTIVPAEKYACVPRDE